MTGIRGIGIGPNHVDTLKSCLSKPCVSKQMSAELFPRKLDYFLQTKVFFGLALNCKIFTIPIMGLSTKGHRFITGHSSFMLTTTSKVKTRG